MNKLSIVLGVAAAVTLAGCVDPTYVKPADRTVTQVKKVEPAPEAEKTPEEAEAKPVEKKTEEPAVVETEKSCTCAPGTKHTAPCACDGADCTCVVEEKKPAAEEKPAVEETTDYIVQRGDYLAKISKKYNVTIAAIRRVNPNLKGDKIRIGQKIKLPGKIDVGEQTVPKGAFAATPKAAPKAYKPYTGATKEYVVKAGDTLGAIAYGNGINIRQLKELNSLKSDRIRVGQKLKIPAEKVVAPKAEKKAEKKVVAEKKQTKAAQPKNDEAASAEVPEEEPAPAPTAPEKVTDAAEVQTQDAAPATAATTTTTPTTKAATGDDYITHEVQEGEDLVALSLRFSVSPSEIRELNNLSENEELKPGQKLRLPANTQF